MSQERISYLDRQIALLRDKQQELSEMYEDIENEIVQYEREADGLEAQLNDNQ